MDVSDLLRPLVDGAPPPPSLTQLARRVRRRQRRARLLAGATLAALVALGVAGAMLLRRSAESTKVRTAGRPAPRTPSTGGATSKEPGPGAAAARNQIAVTRASPSFGPGIATAEIVLVNSDGTHQVQLTHAARDGMVASQPAWSPDRRRLAFIRSTPAGVVNAGTGDIVVMNADGSHPTRLTTGGTDTRPVWAPDGRQLAFSRFTNGLAANLFRMNDDGSGLTQVTHDGAISPTWSPDGTRLAYRSLPGGSPDGGHIFIVNADGTHPRQLTRGLEQGNPAWSPDGTRIAYANSQDNSLYTIRPDGTATKRITVGGGAVAWSPDASHIVYELNLGGRRQIYIANDTGRDARPLVTDSDDDCCATWS